MKKIYHQLKLVLIIGFFTLSYNLNAELSPEFNDSFCLSEIVVKNQKSTKTKISEFDCLISSEPADFLLSENSFIENSNKLSSENSCDFTISFTKLDVLCFGDNTGSIDITVVGNSPPYSFSWSYFSLTTEDLTNLPAGNYSLTVTDGQACQKDTIISIEQAQFPIMGSITGIFTVCNGQCTGSASAFGIFGGTSPYSYNWSTGDNMASIDSLCGGAYTVTITDANSCANIQYVNIIEPPAPLLVNLSSNDISCKNVSEGIINSNVTGGFQFGLTYNWSNGENSSNIQNLDAGTYTVTVENIYGCQAIESIEINEPNPQFLVNAYVENILCNGVQNGNINLDISNASSAISFVWSNGETSEDIENLDAGFYNVEISDTSGCLYIDDMEIVQPNAPLAVSVNGDFTVCHGSNNSVVILDVSGGTTPYSYLFSTGDTINPISGLSAGSYDVTVTDNNGCELISPFVISQPNFPIVITLSATNIACKNALTGAINSMVTGGWQNTLITYEWSNGATSANLNEIGAGFYILTVTDMINGCTETAATFVSEPNPTFSTDLIVSEPLCNGDNNGSIDIEIVGNTSNISYLWNNGNTTQYLNNIGGGIYFVEISNTTGCLYEEFVINEPSNVSTSINSSMFVCNGSDLGSAFAFVYGGTSPYSYLWSNGATNNPIFGLYAGNYALTVTDNNSCEDITPFTINEYDPIIISLSNTDVDCYSESTGSIICNMSASSGLFYSFEWSNGTNTQDLNGVDAGIYSLTVTNMLNQCSATAIDTIFQADQINISYTAVNEIYSQADGYINTFVSGGVSPYSFMWNTGETNENIFNLSSGNYFFSVYDANYCSVDTQITVYSDTCQLIALDSGWNVFSTFIDVNNRDFSDVLFNISNVEIVKDQYGLIYWPQFSINQIGNMSNYNGYLIKLYSQQVLVICGTAIVPETFIIPLSDNITNYLGYVRDSSGEISLMLDNIINNIEIVKNEDGQIFWPIFGINQIGSMIPGEGYLVNMNNQANLVYPAN